MWLRKEQGGSQIGEHAWANDGDVTEVPDALGEQLLAIPGGGFTAVDPPDDDSKSNTAADPAKSEDPETAPEDTGDGEAAKTVTEPTPEPAAPVSEAPKPAQRRSTRTSKPKGAVTE